MKVGDSVKFTHVDDVKKSGTIEEDMGVYEWAEQLGRDTRTGVMKVKNHRDLYFGVRGDDGHLYRVVSTDIERA